MMKALICTDYINSLTFHYWYCMPASNVVYSDKVAGKSVRKVLVRYMNDTDMMSASVVPSRRNYTEGPLFRIDAQHYKAPRRTRLLR